MYGVWNNVRKKWQFSDCNHESKEEVITKLHKKIGVDSAKSRFEIRNIERKKPKKEIEIKENKSIEQALFRKNKDGLQVLIRDKWVTIMDFLLIDEDLEFTEEKIENFKDGIT